MSDDPRIRFRVWVSGALIEDVWLDSTNPDSEEIFEAMQERHVAITNLADGEGKPWMVEVFDPAQPAETAYWRVGTDGVGMIDPQPVPEPIADPEGS